MKSPNKLKYPQLIALSSWYTANKDELLKHTRSVVAEIATNDLGYHITAFNIEGVEKALNITRQNKKPMEDIDRIEILTKNMAWLADHVGYELSKDFYLLTDY